MEVKDRIIEEAIRQFMKFGVRHVTMDDLANNLAISKRTVYEVFKDKNELITTCMQHLSWQQEARQNELLDSTQNVIELMISTMQEGIKAFNSINPVFFYDLKKYYPMVWNQKHLEQREKSLNHIHTQLRKGINEGLFRKDFDIELVSKLFYEQMNLIGDDTIFPKEDYNYADLFKNLMINFIRGISTRKGIDVIEQNLD